MGRHAAGDDRRGAAAPTCCSCAAAASLRIPDGPAAGVASLRQAWRAIRAGQSLADGGARRARAARGAGVLRRAALNATAPRRQDYVWYGDDFTGATDTLATVGRRAACARCCSSACRSPQQLRAAGPLDALGIAGAARAMDPTAMARRARAGGPLPGRARARRCCTTRCCSTFDSSPAVGSLGMALAHPAATWRNAFVPMVGGQPSLGRYCAFGNLFAAAGSTAPCTASTATRR